jgi:hypothetical protein
MRALAKIVRHHLLSPARRGSCAPLPSAPGRPCRGDTPEKMTRREPARSFDRSIARSQGSQPIARARPSAMIALRTPVIAFVVPNDARAILPVRGLIVGRTHEAKPRYDVRASDGTNYRGLPATALERAPLMTVMPVTEVRMAVLAHEPWVHGIGSAIQRRL